VPSVGVIANPFAGKDIRRLVAHASPTSDAAKIGVIRRVVLGAVDGGATRIVLAPDRHRLCERAVDGLSLAATIDVLDELAYGVAADTTTMATRMAKEEVGALVVLGGDGTCRDVAKGWLDAPLAAISTGTNNVFPRSVDATVAGVAAGLVASGAVAPETAVRPAKVLHAVFDDGSPDDLALVDVALVAGNFLGSRAVWDVGTLRAVVAVIAEPATVGLSSIAAMLLPTRRNDPGVVYVEIGAGPHQRTVRAPVAPGAFADVPFTAVSHTDRVVLHGPGVLAFDGERDRLLPAGVSVQLSVRTDGPQVIDIERTLHAAALAQHFTSVHKSS
jgi:hypothetical protein